MMGQFTITTGEAQINVDGKTTTTPNRGRMGNANEIRNFV